MLISGVVGFFAADAGGGSSVTPVGLRGTDQDRSSSASTLTFTFPVGSAAGDRAVVFVSGAWSSSTPAGWTMLTEANGTNMNGEIITKLLSSSDISTGSVTITFAATATVSEPIHLAGAVFEGDPNIRDYDGRRSLSSSGTETLTVDAESGDYALWYAGSRANTSLSCSKGAVLETTVDAPWLEMAGGTLASGDISAGTASADWTVTSSGDFYVAAVSLIPITILTSDRVTDTGEQRVTSDGDVRVTTERTA